MKFVDTSPIYNQIADDIKQQIIKGDLMEGKKISSVRECCEHYDVTPLTMQRAITKLEIDGIIRTQKGVGCFVNEGIVSKLAYDESHKAARLFVDTMLKMGFCSEDVLNTVKEELLRERNTQNK